jgi:hypothetical protein
MNDYEWLWMIMNDYEWLWMIMNDYDFICKSSKAK